MSTNAKRVGALILFDALLVLLGAFLLATPTHAQMARQACEFNTTAPTAQTGYAVGAQCDNRGNQKVSVSNPDGTQATAGTTAGLSTTPGLPASWWRYAPPVGGYLNKVTADTIKTAAGANVFNYVWGGECFAEALTTATEIALRDGAAGTVMWRMKVPTTGWTQGFDISFTPPLRGTANTLVEFVGLTATGTGAIYCNWRGSTGP